MAYRRRYLSGQSATTVVIAEGAITSDKIIDGAVTHPKLASGSVDSDKVINESLKSEDIKDGEIKSSDLAPNSVTTEKILDGAVTIPKLESAIQGISRPLTPGVDTAEILNDAVTEPKLATNSVGSDALKPGSVNEAALAGDAVVTGKIKDAQITLAKMAPDSIDNTVIKANAIRGTEIAAGAVGVTQLGTGAVEFDKISNYAVTPLKLSNDAVTTRSILDDAVTEPKLDSAALARRHIESKDARVLTHFEEFGGLDISNKWVRTVDAGGLILTDIETNAKEGLRFQTSDVNDNNVRITWGNHWLGIASVLKPFVNIWIPKRGSPVNKFNTYLGLWDRFLEAITFLAEDDAGVTPNWKAMCRSAGADTVVDTGIAVTTGLQLLSIDVISGSQVKFYINGIEVAEITTNIPTEPLEPCLELENGNSGADRSFWVKYFSILAVRPDYP